MTGLPSLAAFARGAVALLACVLGLLSLPASAFIAADRPAPDFTLQSAVGANVRLSEQRGKVVVIQFFTSACGPCRAQMTVLNRLAEKYKDAGLLVLGVSIDDDSASTLNTIARLGINYPVLLDRARQAARAYQLQGVPSTALVDRDGRLRYAHSDYRDGQAAMYETQIQELLRQ